MAEHGNARAAELRSAREARALLSETSAALQLSDGTDLERAVESVALASSTLYELEVESPPSQDYRNVRTAISHLSDAMHVLQALPSRPGTDAALEGLARTFAVLYPVARTHQRRRREVIMEVFSGTDSIRSLAATAPEPTGVPPAPHAFGGANKRGAGNRVFVEVDIGFASQSHFYTGLSRDLSSGGVFVATYMPQPPGTKVAVHFVLPDGRAVKAGGVVRWTVPAQGDVAPGMGVAFEDLEAEDLNAIVEFCSQRSPIYHLSGDD